MNKISFIKKSLALFCAVVLIFSCIGCEGVKDQLSNLNPSSNTTTSSEVIGSSESTGSSIIENSNDATESTNTSSGTESNNSSSKPSQSSSNPSSKPGSSQTSTPSSSTSSNNPSTDNTPTQPKQWYTRKVELSRADLNRALSQKYVKPKNVILLIGDGMGLNDLELAKDLSRDKLFDFGLVMENLPNIGLAKTHNYSGGVTDSAASATALATGYKTLNGRLGLDHNGRTVQNVLEIARANGKKVGIVTDDSFVGATPSAFTVHNPSRENKADIARSFLEFMPDVLIGGDFEIFNNATAAAKYTQKRNSITIADGFGWFEDKLNEAPDKPFFGFHYLNSPASSLFELAHCTEIALNKLDNKNGFFLMVESYKADRGGHNNSLSDKLEGVCSLNNVAAVAIKYCLKNPDTVLIITSDHETGGITLNNPNGWFTTTGHTGVNVGVFAIGYGTENFKNKTVDNTDIAKFIINLVKKG